MPVKNHVPLVSRYTLRNSKLRRLTEGTPITKEETLIRIIRRTCFVTSIALLLLFSIAAGASMQKKDKKPKG
jgi:hypothetical protein